MKRKTCGLFLHLMALVLLGAQAAQASVTLQGRLYDQRHFNPSTGQIELGQDGYAGGYFYDPVNVNGLNSGLSSAAGLAQAVFSASPFIGLPSGDIKRALMFEFQVTGFGLTGPNPLDNPNLDYRWSAEWSMQVFTGPPENAISVVVPFSVNGVASLNDLLGGWVPDASGTGYIMGALYANALNIPTRGFLLWASTEPLTAGEAWWNDLDGDPGDGRYQFDDTNSAYIMTADDEAGSGAGDVNLAATAVPEPASLLSWLLLGAIGIAAWARRRRPAG